MRDKIRYWIEGIAYRLDLTRETGKAIGIAVGISLIIVAIILAVAMPRRTYFQEQVDTLSAVVLQNQGTVDQVWNTTQNTTDLLNSYRDQLIDALSRIIALEGGSLNPQPATGYYLGGSFPDYKLYVTPSTTGNFTANLHLVYQPAVGNATSYNQTLTEFYAGINFTALPPAYVPIVTHNGTGWGISEVWFNIGVYGIELLSMAVIPITCVGLNLTPSFVYVEVFKV